MTGHRGLLVADLLASTVISGLASPCGSGFQPGDGVSDIAAV
jgi:hypothetical protein